MTTLKGHFDGTAIVLDEPADLAVGQAVQILVARAPAAPPAGVAQAPKRESVSGFAKGQFGFTMSDDFDEPLEEFADYR